MSRPPADRRSTRPPRRHRRRPRISRLTVLAGSALLLVTARWRGDPGGRGAPPRRRSRRRARRTAWSPPRAVRRVRRPAVLRRGLDRPGPGHRRRAGDPDHHRHDDEHRAGGADRPDLPVPARAGAGRPRPTSGRSWPSRANRTTRSRTSSPRSSPTCPPAASAPFVFTAVDHRRGRPGRRARRASTR